MFKHPVNVEFLDSAQFEQQASVPQPTLKSDQTALNHALGELRALGLVHGNVNLATAENTLTQADVVGLYVPTKKTVFVRVPRVTPYVRTTLAHELTHALQDQYFDLTRLKNSAKDGDETAVTALIEGDAVRIQNAYEQNLSPSDQRAYESEQAQIEKNTGQTGNVPEILSDILSFPYAFGPTFVDSLASQGGNATVDHAFRDPPVAEAQILDPVVPPGMEAGSGSGTGDRRWSPSRQAKPVRAGVVVRGAGQPACARDGMGRGAGMARRQLGAVQGQRQDVHGHRCGHGKRRLVSTACRGRQPVGTGDPWRRCDTRGSTSRSAFGDPGPTAPPPPVITPSSFDVLSARAEITDEIMTNAQVDFAMGQCVADGVIAGVGPAGYGDAHGEQLVRGPGDTGWPVGGVIYR